MSIEPVGSLVFAIGKLAPYGLVIGAFTFLYLFIPNTRVRFGPAFAAGVIGGILWQSAGWGFAAFVTSSTRYAAIYSSFAVLVLFLIWLYVSWLVLLVGAALSFYLQHPEYLYAMPGEPRLSNRVRERLGIAVMYLIASHFVRGRPPWTLHQLTQRLAIPMHSVNAVLDALAEGRLVTPTGDDPPAYLPARDLAEISVAEVLAAVRRAGEVGFMNPDSIPFSQSVNDVVARMEEAMSAATEAISVRTLAGVAPGDDESGDRGAASERH